MNNVTLDSVLEQAEQLSIDEQILLSNILHKRLTEEKRNKLIQSVKEGITEYKAGLTHTGTVDDLFNELDIEE